MRTRPGRCCRHGVPGNLLRRQGPAWRRGVLTLVPAVRSALLGAELGRDGAVNTRYTTRSINGVATRLAVAVRTVFPNTPVGTADQNRQCGRWSYAPAADLTNQRARSLACRVGVPSRIHLPTC